MLLCGASHRIEELLALVPLVIPLPARLTVEFDLVFVLACEAPECSLLHKTLGTINIFIAPTIISAFREGLLCADTPRNSIADL